MFVRHFVGLMSESRAQMFVKVFQWIDLHHTVSAVRFCCWLHWSHSRLYISVTCIISCVLQWGEPSWEIPVLSNCWHQHWKYHYRESTWYNYPGQMLTSLQWFPMLLVWRWACWEWVWMTLHNCSRVNLSWPTVTCSVDWLNSGRVTSVVIDWRLVAEGQGQVIEITNDISVHRAVTNP